MESALTDRGSLATSALHAALRDAILERRLDPGALVTETAVAARYGVARPTARLAIERLVADGLLRRAPHRAARIPTLDASDISDIFDARALVEQAAIERLAGSGAIPADALAAHRELLANDGSAPFARVDARFHRALVAAQPNARLARMHGLLMGEIELCIAQVQAERVLTPAEIGAQHQAILDAITAGDAAHAGRLARDHVHGARDRLLAAVAHPSDERGGD